MSSVWMAVDLGAGALGLTHTMVFTPFCHCTVALDAPCFSSSEEPDQGQGDGHGEDGGHRHQAVAPQVGDRLPRDVAGRDRHQVRVAKLPGSSPAGACSAMAPVGEPAPAAAVALSMP